MTVWELSHVPHLVLFFFFTHEPRTLARVAGRKFLTSMASFRSNGSNCRSYNSGSSSFVSGGRCERQWPPECRCGAQAVVRTVTKMCANRGRKFWGCRFFVAPGIPSGCNFFDWYSEPVAQTQVFENPTCAECAQKEMEIMSLRRTILKIHGDEKASKNLIKIVTVTCFLLAVTCVMLMFIVFKTGKGVFVYQGFRV